MTKKPAHVLVVVFTLVASLGATTGIANASAPITTTSKAKINCAKAREALLDLNYQYQKIQFLDSANAWATTAQDPLGGRLDGVKLQANAKALKGLQSVKTSKLGFPPVKQVLARITQLGPLVDSALTSSTPFPGPGQEAYDLVTKNAVGDRSALGYAFEKRGCQN